MPVKAHMEARPIHSAPPRVTLANAVLKPKPSLALPEAETSRAHANVGRNVVLQGTSQSRYQWTTPRGAIKLPGLPYSLGRNGHIPLPVR